MLRRFALVAVLAAAPTLAQTKGEIDWNRRVLLGHGQGAPDLNAPSVAVARLGAERAAGLAKGSGVPNRTKVGKVSRAQVREIAELKAPDLNSATVDAAERMVMGTARSMGIDIAD